MTTLITDTKHEQDQKLVKWFSTVGVEVFSEWLIAENGNTVSLNEKKSDLPHNIISLDFKELEA